MLQSVMKSVLSDGCTVVSAAHWVDREAGQNLQTDQLTATAADDFRFLSAQ